MGILVLHHQFERWAEDTSFELVYKMAELMVALCLLRYMRIIKAELSLADDDISIPEIHQEVAIASLEPIFDAHYFDLLARSTYFGIL